MATNHTRKFRGIAAPVLVREPLLVRLCTTFVNNLTLILRTGLVMGAVLLVHDLRILLDKDPSLIYLSPHADPDDTGHVNYDAPVLYARHDANTSVE